MPNDDRLERIIAHLWQMVDDHYKRRSCPLCQEARAIVEKLEVAAQAVPGPPDPPRPAHPNEVA